MWAFKKKRFAKTKHTLQIPADAAYWITEWWKGLIKVGFGPEDYRLKFEPQQGQTSQDGKADINPQKYVIWHNKPAFKLGVGVIKNMMEGKLKGSGKRF